MKDVKDTAIMGGLLLLGFYVFVFKEICWPIILVFKNFGLIYLGCWLMLCGFATIFNEWKSGNNEWKAGVLNIVFSIVLLIIGFILIRNMPAEAKETGLARVFGLLLVTILGYIFCKWKKELEDYI